MATFKPTPAQQEFIDMASSRFEARLAQPKRKPSPFSRYFLAKCSDELGINPPRVHKPRVHPLQRNLFSALERMFGRNNWLIRLFHHHE